MNALEHLYQAEALLEEAQRSPTTPAEERQVWVIAAVAHAILARVRQEWE